MAPPSGGWACLEFQPDRDPRTKRLAVMFIRHRRGGGGLACRGPWRGAEVPGEDGGEADVQRGLLQRPHRHEGPQHPEHRQQPTVPPDAGVAGGAGQGKGVGGAQGSFLGQVGRILP